MTPALLAAGRRRYVSLTTFRRSGAGVATTVWIAPLGDALIVTTGAETGKVKRLRRDPRVELRESTVRGRVRPGAPAVHAQAEIVRDPAEQERLTRALAAKYGVLFRLVQSVERLAASFGYAGNVVLRITDTALAEGSSR